MYHLASEDKANIQKAKRFIFFYQDFNQSLQKMSRPELIGGVWALLPELTGDGVKQDSHQCQYQQQVAFLIPYLYQNWRAMTSAASYRVVTRM